MGKKKAKPKKKPKGLAAIVAGEVSAASRVAAALLAADDAAPAPAPEAAKEVAPAAPISSRKRSRQAAAGSSGQLFDIDEAGKSLEFFGDDKRGRKAARREDAALGSSDALPSASTPDAPAKRRGRKEKRLASSAAAAAAAATPVASTEAAKVQDTKAMDDSEQIVPLTEESLRQEQRGALDVLSSVLERDDDAKSEASIDDPLPKKPAAATRNARKVFIGNLPWKADEDMLRTDFGECGLIETFNMPKNKQSGNPMGVAFIVFESEEAVANALKYDGKTYIGRKLRVNLANPDAVGKDKEAGKVGAETIDKTVEKAPSVGRHQTRVTAGERVGRTDDRRESKKVDGKNVGPNDRRESKKLDGKKAQKQKRAEGTAAVASKPAANPSSGADKSKSLLVQRWSA